MKYIPLCAAFIATLIFFIPATASPLDDKVAALKKAIKEEVAARSSAAPNTPQLPAYANASYIVANLDQITAQADNPNTGENVEMEISQILSAYSSDEVQKAGQDLIAEIRLERKAHADAATAEIQALLKRVSDEVAAAKKPEDLDGILVDLQTFQGGRNGGYNAENQALYQQVSAAFEFTKLWQNYLSHLASGQTQLATNDLQNLSQNNYGVGIIPRSHILELLATPAAAAGKDAVGAGPMSSEAANILKGIKTLDDMEPALQKLDSLRSNNGDAQVAFSNLATFEQLYANVKAGIPSNLNLNFNNVSGKPSVSPELQVQLLVFVLQHYFDSYQGTPPAPDEKPEAFVKRVIVDATSREDWPLLQKALDAQSYLKRNSVFGSYTGSYATSNISTGVDNLLTGLNQEAAGQYALAVVSYQSALKVADTNIPAKLIGDKLAAIQKDHPKEYEDGMQMVISPPVRYYPVMNPGMSYRPGTPGYPSYPTIQPNPGLAIPGAATNPAAAPAPAAPAPASTNAPPAK